jgi:hypothetical protein
MVGIYEVAIEKGTQPSFVSIGSGIQKFVKGDTQTVWRAYKPFFFLRKVG